MTSQDPPLHFRVLASLRVDCLGGVAYGNRLPSEPDLAARYGVSRATIRRAIAALITEGVLEARHGAGTFIRPGSDRGRTIGLLIAESVAKDPDDPYVQKLVNNLLAVLARHGWTLRLARNAEDMSVHLASGRGAIVSACVAAFFAATEDIIKPLSCLPVPLVMLDSELHPDLSCVLADNERGMRQAVEQVIALGHRDIVHIAGGQWALSGRERLAGFRAAMAGAGLVLREGDIFQGHFDYWTGHAAMKAWASAGRRPTAVVCGNDLMALGAMRWMEEQGLRPGIDISLVGCDDILLAAYARPGLATVALDFPAHAQAVLDAVLDVEHPGVRRTPMRLIERASLGPPSGASSR